MSTGLFKAYVSKINVGDRHRALNKTRIEALAKSMDDIGLQTPITIHKDEIGDIHLTAGLHRLEAAKSLNWRMIDAWLVDMSPTQREMWEIAENLHRVDLTKKQRDEQIKRYDALLTKLAKEKLQSGQNGQIESKRADGRGHRPEGNARKIAEATGLSERTIRRALKPQPPKPEPAKTDEDAQAKRRNRVARAWNELTQDDREWFRDWIDQTEAP